MRDRRRAGLGLLAAAAVAAAALLAPGTSGSFTAAITNTTDTAKAATQFTCSDVFAAVRTKAANTYFEYTLTEAAGTTGAADSSAAGNPGIYQGTHSTDTATPTACPNDAPKVAYAPAGTASAPQYVTTTNTVGASPTTFSLVVWFKTSTKSGRLIGLGNQQTGASGIYDRQVYLQPTGQLSFGTYLNGYQIITSPSGRDYADGLWHQVVATLTPGTPNTGMSLYVDGALAAANTAYTSAQSNTGYWRIGYDSLGSSWTGGTATNASFVGSIKYAAAYRYALSPGEVRSMYSIGLPA
ncbi:LamG-like jellyroll fold domain-containing protein [Amnibacterium endophyticum]|uniref:LamG-like jellyroll fold domain-containing protein n=1 Tax=Amnibacterium endophyticum TaxID=2109337 RepID=A0ABW4LFQ7_9MICO